MSKRSSLLAKVHIARKDLGLDEDTYRDMLRDVLGVSSAGDATDRQLGTLLGHLRGLGWQDKPPRRPFPTPKEVTSPRHSPGCAALMDKIGAQLADAKRPWSYATALSRRICKVDALEWCKAKDLKKIVAALDYDAKRRARRASA